LPSVVVPWNTSCVPGFIGSQALSIVVGSPKLALSKSVATDGRGFASAVAAAFVDDLPPQAGAAISRAAAAATMVMGRWRIVGRAPFLV
jgi:hypothetical protein